jgi:nifR3 family TIM-barrel protein
MMKFHEVERPFGIQIFGYDIGRMTEAAKMVEDAGVDLLDINCGCPAPKVVRKGGGCELMRQPDHLTKMLRAVRAAVSIPLTLKMRSGWDDATLNSPHIARIAESEGIEGVAIHGRTRAQLYRGLANWQWVAEVKSQSAIPVFGSGDVVDKASADERAATGCDGIFIGRGALSNPFVFTEIVTGVKPDLRREPIRAVNILLRYVELLREEMHDRAASGRVKQLASQMCAGLPWKRDLLRTEALSDQITFLETIKATHEGGH